MPETRLKKTRDAYPQSKSIRSRYEQKATVRFGQRVLSDRWKCMGCGAPTFVSPFGVVEGTCTCRAGFTTITGWNTIEVEGDHH